MVPRLTIALLVILAGCSGISGESPDQEITGEPTIQPTTVPSPRATGSATADATPPGATETNTLEYAELSATQKRAFDASVDGGARSLDESVRESPYVEGVYFDPGVFEAFESPEYVRKNETYYRISTRHGNTIASYHIEATEEEPAENATVVAFENLSTRTGEPVRWAIENESYQVPPGKWRTLPRNLSRADYVRYDGRHFALGYTVGDAWPLVLTAEEVD